MSHSRGRGVSRGWSNLRRARTLGCGAYGWDRVGREGEVRGEYRAAPRNTRVIRGCCIQIQGEVVRALEARCIRLSRCIPPKEVEGRDSMTRRINSMISC